MADWPILSLVTFLPLVGAAFVLLVRGESVMVARNARAVALWTTLINFGLSLVIWINFDNSTSDFQFEEQAPWLSDTITYHMGVDGISMLFIILTTFLSFLFYRRAGKIPTVSWAKPVNVVVASIFAAAAVAVIYLGVMGYYVPSLQRVNLLTPGQVGVVLAVLFLVTVIDVILYRRASSTGEVQWGKMTDQSQYILILLAVTFCSMMGLMGYVRSGIREDWHIYGVMRDTSPDAFTPTIGVASNIIAAIVIIFGALICFIFWLGSMGDKKEEAAN